MELERIPSIYSRLYRFARFAREQDRLKWRNRQYLVFFVRVQAKTRLEQGFRASYAMGKEAIIARVRQFVTNAGERGKAAMAYHVSVARV